MIQAAVDLNVRLAGNLTYVGFEDMDTPVTEEDIGKEVLVIEVELVCDCVGVIRKIDFDNKLVYIEVPWHKMRFNQEE